MRHLLPMRRYPTYRKNRRDPRQIGFAAGVTLGLGTTIGGIIVPLLGMLADRYGIMPAMYVIAAVGVMAALIVRWLPDPAARQQVLRARN